MERLFYMLTSVKRPAVLAEFGSFWGNTLAWFASPCIGRKPAYRATVIYGIDIDVDATAMAKENFGNLKNTQVVEFITEDARTALERLPGPFDFVYTEAKEEQEENLYLSLLKQVYPKLSDGAWFMAHDTTRWTFCDELADYFAFVRDKRWFRESISFDVDAFGIELSVK